MKIRDLMFAATIGMAVSHMPHAADVQAPASELLTAGEVRKVDKDAGKVTIRHAPIKHLDMPAMTMVFQVKDKAMLDKLKAGDKSNFTADQLNGAYTVLTFEPAK